jgi:hypothetical protein
MALAEYRLGPTGKGTYPLLDTPDKRLGARKELSTELGDPTGNVAGHGRPTPGWVHDADGATELLAIG